MSRLFWLIATLALVAAAASGFYFDRFMRRPIELQLTMPTQCPKTNIDLHPYTTPGIFGSCTLPWNLCQKTA